MTEGHPAYTRELSRTTSPNVSMESQEVIRGYDALAEGEHALLKEAPPHARGTAKRFILASLLAAASLMGSAGISEAAEQSSGRGAPTIESIVQFKLTESTIVRGEDAGNGPITIARGFGSEKSYQLRVRIRKLLRVDKFGGKAYGLEEVRGGYQIGIQFPGEAQAHSFDDALTGRLPMSYTVKIGQALQVRMNPETVAAAEGGEIIIDAIRAVSPSR